MTESASPAVVEVDLGGPYTLAEIAEIEQLAGLSMARWFDGVSPEGELRRAIAYVVTRRSDPAFTLVAAGELVVRVDR